MKLSYESIQNRAAWEAAGVTLPKYDWKDMAAETEAHPTWVHFGSGSLFRAFHAMLQQSLIGQGLVKGGLIAAVLVWLGQLSGVVPAQPDTPVLSFFTVQRLGELLDSLPA